MGHCFAPRSRSLCVRTTVAPPRLSQNPTKAADRTTCALSRATMLSSSLP